jgi:hypothetical protein
VNEWQLVPMGDVPVDAPIQKRGNKYSRIVTALLGLGPNEAIRVSTGGIKQLAMFRTELRRVARRSTSRVVNAKRDAEGKNLWVWLEPVDVQANVTRVTVTYPAGFADRTFVAPFDTIHQALH